jgi:hypothetical protein
VDAIIYDRVRLATPQGSVRDDRRRRMMRRRRLGTNRAAVAVMLLLVTGLALIDAPATASSGMPLALAGQPATTGLSIRPSSTSTSRPGSAADTGRTRPRPIDDLAWPLLAASRLTTVPIYSRSSGPAGGTRPQTPQPEWYASHQPPIAARSGSWLALPSFGATRPARLAGANRSAPRPPPLPR